MKDLSNIDHHFITDGTIVEFSPDEMCTLQFLIEFCNFQLIKNTPQESTAPAAQFIHKFQEQFPFKKGE